MAHAVWLFASDKHTRVKEQTIWRGHHVTRQK
jgi:hypothetical protein